MVELRAAVRRSRTAVYVAPTGSGKTVVGTNIGQRASSKGSQILWLTHRRELIEQTVATMTEAAPGVTIGVEAAGWPTTPWAQIQIGMVQSLVRREHVADPDLIIIDEAHHTRAPTWGTVLDRWPDVPRVGLTATPQRLDGKGLDEYFAEMVLGPTIPELVADDYLAPALTLTVPVGFSAAKLRTNSTGDYRPSDVREAVNQTPKVIARAADSYMKYARGKKAIFFGVHRDHSRKVAAELQSRGVSAAHVDGGDHNARRDRIMKGFKHGAIDVVCNVDIISEGFDAPECEVVMMGAPTKSVTRFLQMAGRAMRPGLEKTALILDLAEITHHLGLPDDLREWSLEDGEVVDEQQKAKRRPRICDRCFTAHHGRVCPNCNYAAPMLEVAEIETDLEIAKGKRNKTSRRRDWKKIEVSRAKHATDPRAELTRIATERGYKSGWVGHMLRVWGLDR